MSQKAEFHNLDRPDDSLFRELSPGLTTHIFGGEQAMLSSFPEPPLTVSPGHLERATVDVCRSGI